VGGDWGRDGGVGYGEGGDLWVRRE